MSTIIHGDCLEVLAGMGPDSVDAVVTDPPYGLKFMGKDWDHGLPGVHFWEAVSRVLKPGAHLLAFGGTRTFHRLTCAVEDAGFEIRDCLMWLYSQGFPKGHDVAYKLHQEAEQEAEHDVRFVRDAYLSQAVYACHECGQVLLTCLSEPGASQHWRTWSESKATGCEQPGVEGWSHLETPERELLRCPVCSMSHGILADGAARRLRDGAQCEPASEGPDMSESVTRDRKLQPFWSGTEFLDWESANCCRCALYSETETQPYVWGECPFHDALSEASVGDGLVDAELAARYGCTLEVVERGRPWPCSRRVPVPDEEVCRDDDSAS